MAWSIDGAAQVADHLERFAHSHAHQLAGQVASLDFWHVPAGTHAGEARRGRAPAPLDRLRVR
jgi:hypothetical protein